MRGLLQATALGLGLRCWFAAGLDSWALVQSSVQLEPLKASAGGQQMGKLPADEEIDEYLLDNSQLHHRGPGVLYRRSKDSGDVFGKDEYAEWGSVVTGASIGDGWLRVGQRYLPEKVQGVQVLVKKDPSKPKTITHTEYRPTKIRMPDGSWVDANITGIGEQPGTFNVLVIPRTFGSYEMVGVPAKQLAGVETVTMQRLVRSSDQRGGSVVLDDGSLVVKVQDFVGNPMSITLTRESSLRQLMDSACEKASVAVDKCSEEVHFIFHGRHVKPDEPIEGLQLEDGDTMYMLRRKVIPPLDKRAARQAR